MSYQNHSLEFDTVSQPLASQDVSAGRLWLHDGSLIPEVVFVSWNKENPSVHYLSGSTYWVFIESVTTLYTTLDYCNSSTTVIVSTCN